MITERLFLSNLHKKLKTDVDGTQENHLREVILREVILSEVILMSTRDIGSGKAILMSTHNIGFYEEISKIIPYYQICTLSVLLPQATLPCKWGKYGYKRLTQCIRY